MQFLLSIWAGIKTTVSTVKDKLVAVYNAAENKLKLADGLVNSFIEDISGNKNRNLYIVIGLAIAVFKFSDNVIIDVAALVAVVVCFTVDRMNYSPPSPPKQS